MNVATDPSSFTHKGCCIALGSFDGVHRGHREIFRRLYDESFTLGVPACAFTFFPHPREVLLNRQFSYIQTLGERLKSFEKCGIESVYVCIFDEYFAKRDPAGFVTEFLNPIIEPAGIIVGRNFRFGKDRSGGVEQLEKLCADIGTKLVIVEPIESDGGVISSTRIRESLAKGDITLANNMLGKRWYWTGIVGRGKGEGRRIGYPTINLRQARPAILPDGVYKTSVEISGRRFQGITYLDKSKRVNETHIFDFNEDVYGCRADVYPEKFVRSPREFTGFDDLVRWIRDDIREAYPERIL